MVGLTVPKAWSDTTVAGFIDEANEAAAAQSDYNHRQLDRTFGMQEEESAEEIARRLDERHIRQRAATRYNTDSDQIPQRLLMPGVNDPSLWCVRCKVSVSGPLPSRCSSM